MAIVSFLSLSILQRNSNLFPIYLAVPFVVLPHTRLHVCLAEYAWCHMLLKIVICFNEFTNGIVSNANAKITFSFEFMRVFSVFFANENRFFCSLYVRSWNWQTFRVSVRNKICRRIFKKKLPHDDNSGVVCRLVGRKK